MLQQFATSPAKKVLMRTSNDNYSNCCIVFNVTTPGRRPPTFIPKWDLLQYKLNGNEGRSLLGMQLNLEQNWQHGCCCTAANSMPCSSILGSQFAIVQPHSTPQKHSNISNWIWKLHQSVQGGCKTSQQLCLRNAARAGHAYCSGQFGDS